MTFATTVDALHGYVEQLAQLQSVVGQPEMSQHASTLQRFFNQTLWLRLVQVELSQHQAQWRSATTELHRHMRLLAVEINFVQSARHSDKRQQRLAQLEQRLQQLQGFAQVLIKLCSSRDL
ncbi:MAG: heterocyst frequency control protein PatD [Cyanobacteria bacterium P01_H01_bin.105]